MNFVIDPGYDYEVQEIEEFLNQKPVETKKLVWKFKSKQSVDNIVILVDGISSEFKFEGTLVGELLDEHKNEIGASLYLHSGLYILSVKKQKPENDYHLAKSIEYLVQYSKKVSILTVEQGHPSRTQDVQIFDRSSSDFKTITGLAANLLTRFEILEKEVVLYRVIKDGNALESFQKAAEFLKQRHGSQILFDQKRVSKILTSQPLNMFL